MYDIRQIKSHPFYALLALSLGAFIHYVWVIAWGMYVGQGGIGNSLIDWLLEITVKQGHKSSFWVLITIHDTCVNIILTLPFMYLLNRLKPRGSYVYLLFALCGFEAISLVWSSNRTLEGYFSHLFDTVSNPYYLIGNYGAFLIAFFIIKHLHREIAVQT